MVISTILLSLDDKYLTKDGKLPHPRPSFDKELLTELCKNKDVSHKGYLMLPPSIRQIVRGVAKNEPSIGITIPEIDALTDLLIVTRSQSRFSRGKRFRFDNFKLLVADKKIEIWIRK